MAVAYGARWHAPEVTAAPLTDDGLGEFAPPEELDPTALPFLHPLQHAVDALPADDAPGRGRGEGGLPMFE